MVKVKVGQNECINVINAKAHLRQRLGDGHDLRSVPFVDQLVVLPDTRVDQDGFRRMLDEPGMNRELLEGVVLGMPLGHFGDSPDNESRDDGGVHARTLNPSATRNATELHSITLTLRYVGYMCVRHCAVEIRERSAADLDDLVAVAARVHKVDNYPIFLPGGDLVRFLRNPTPLAAWVALRGGQLIGHVALNDTTSRPVMQVVEDRRPTLPAAYVARLLVDPSSRGDGVGWRLLERARRAAIEVGRSPFLDVVDTATAASAISLYRKAGWEEIGRVSFDLVGDEIEELVFCGPLT